MDIAPTIVPKSDQLNADDLITGPRTIRITSVTTGRDAQQPIAIHFEGDDGRPYLPSKSMRRVLVALWGSEGTAYVGRRLTLYRDPSVRYGGEAVGGIRISHASDITSPLVIALTETRGKRKPHRVDPLPPDTHSPTQHGAHDAHDAPDIPALCDVGETKAREGVDSLRVWWSSLDRSTQHALKDKLARWKQLAAEGGESQ